MSIQVEQAGRVTVITINRPDVRNAVDAQTASELLAAFTQFDTDDNSDVAVLAGAGRVFCSGADLKAVTAGSVSQLRTDGPGPMGPTRLMLSKPLIAAVEGYAVAGGLELALWCDLRAAAEDAVFGVFCRRWGVPLVDGGTIRLSRLIGHSHALDLILTGRGVKGDEARMMGLANRIVPPGKSVTAAVELAKSLSEFPQKCMRSDRQSSYEQWSLPVSEALQ